MANATVPGYTPETQQIMTGYWGDIDAVMNAWVEAGKVLATAKLTEMRLRKAIFEVKFPNPSLGTQRADLANGWQLKAVYGLNYKLANKNGETEAAQDALAKIGNDGAFVAERLIKWSPELSITEYKLLKPEHKAIIDAVLTTTPAAPSLEIEEPKKNMTCYRCEKWAARTIEAVQNREKELERNPKIMYGNACPQCFTTDWYTTRQFVVDKPKPEPRPTLWVRIKRAFRRRD